MRRTRRSRSVRGSLIVALAVVLATLMPLVPAGTAAEEGDAPLADQPTVEATTEPPPEPTAVLTEPTAIPDDPTTEPTAVPADPTDVPADPTDEPSSEPTDESTEEPTVDPTAEPTAVPTVESTAEPAEEPAARQRMSIMAIETTGTITKTASTTTPIPGEILIVTISAWGEAEGGTSLFIQDAYQHPRVDILDTHILEAVNVTNPTFTPYIVPTAGVRYEDAGFETETSGEYRLTYQIEMQVLPSLSPGDTINAFANLSELFQGGPNNHLSSSGQLQYTVSGDPIPLTGTITKTASNTTPAPGETVTFTITATGRAEAGTELIVLDRYQLSGLTISNPRSGDQLNVTSSSHQCVENTALGLASCDVELSVVEDGFYRATYVVDATVALDASGTIDAFAELWNDSVSPGVELDSDFEPLTVTPGPIETTGTISMVPSTTTPNPGDTVTFTITVSGRASAGQELTIIHAIAVNDLTVGSTRVIERNNVTDPDVSPYFSSSPAYNFQRVRFDTELAGEYRLVIEVDVVVSDSVPGGAVVVTYAVLYVGIGPLVLDQTGDQYLTVPLSAPTVGKTTTSVTGEQVTYDVTVSGSAATGTELVLTDALPAGLTLASVSDSSTSVTVGANSGSSTTVTLPLTVDADGPFSTTITLVTDVAADVVPGTVLDDNTACVDVTNGPQDTCSDAAAATIPLTAPVVTKTSTGPAPRPGDPVTWVVTISGTSVADTGIVLTDVVPAELTLAGVTTTASDNVTVGANTGGAGTVELPLTVDADGSWSATVEIATTLNSGVAAETVVENTACVDLVDGPQDTCASAEVTTLRAYTWLELLLQQIVALIVLIVTESIP